jgi:hypothetical protein
MNPLIQLKNNIVSLLVELMLGCFGLLPAVQAVVPAPDGGYPGGNTAEGQSALFSRTGGGYNTAVGFFSLRSDTTGSFNTGNGAGALLANNGDSNTATGAGALLSNTTGFYNTADGAFALFSETTGSGNTGSGYRALFTNQTGSNNAAYGYTALEHNTSSFNTAFGSHTLVFNTTGTANTAIGYQALVFNDGGRYNIASGYQALYSNTIGQGNTAVGLGALSSNTIGDHAIGFTAGSDLTTGNVNIDIGNVGIAGEGGTIRIGDENHVATYIAGIAGQTVGAGGTTCYVDNEGKLGVFLSARRYKENIQRMDDASAALFLLKPVTFRSKPEFDKSGTPQFGLIAEEVAEVSPNLVTHNPKGELSTVRSEAVNAMLLNEFLKEHRTVQEQGATIRQQRKDFEAAIAQQKKEIAALTATVKEQAAQIQKVSAQLEVSKVAPQTVFNTADCGAASESW